MNNLLKSIMVSLAFILLAGTESQAYKFFLPLWQTYQPTNSHQCWVCCCYMYLQYYDKTMTYNDIWTLGTNEVDIDNVMEGTRTGVITNIR